MFKRFFIRKSTNWEKFLGIKISAEQRQVDEEMRVQVAKNGIYSIFDKSNSKEEVIKRLNERKNENWKRAGIIIGGISVLVTIAKICLGI